MSNDLLHYMSFRRYLSPLFLYLWGCGPVARLIGYHARARRSVPHSFDQPVSINGRFSSVDESHVKLNGSGY